MLPISLPRGSGWAGKFHACTSADVITAVRQLVLIANDNLIAGILNRNGLKSGNGTDGPASV